MKFTKLALASVAAIGLAGVAQADTYYVQEGLDGQGWEPGAAPTNGVNAVGGIGTDGAVWFGGLATDDTAVMDYDDAGVTPAAAEKRPTGSAGPMDTGNNFLKISNSNPLWRIIKAEGYGQVNNEWPTEFPNGMDVAVGNGLYVDTLVQFTPSEEPPTPEDGSKLIVWMNTNNVLCVTANKLTFTGSGEDWIPAYNANSFETDANVETGKWYRLTVMAYSNLIDVNGQGTNFKHGFEVYINGTAVKSDEAAVNTDSDEFFYGTGGFNTALPALEADFKAGKLFLSLSSAQSATLAAVGFKGEGCVDNIVVSDVRPTFNQVEPSGIDFTLTWDAGVSAVWYAIDGETNNYSDVVSTGLSAGKTVEYGGAWGVPGSIVLADGHNAAKIVLAEDGEAAGVEGGLAGFTVAQLQAAFPGASPTDINNAANAYLKYQFGLALSDTMTAAPTLKIVDIAESATPDAWDIKIQVLNGSDPLVIDDGASAQTSPMRATLKVIAADTLAGLGDDALDAQYYDIVYDETTTDLTITVKTGAFFKARIDYAVPANN